MRHDGRGGKSGEVSISYCRKKEVCSVVRLCGCAVLCVVVLYYVVWYDLINLAKNCLQQKGG